MTTSAQYPEQSIDGAARLGDAGDGLGGMGPSLASMNVMGPDGGSHVELVLGYAVALVLSGGKNHRSAWCGTGNLYSLSGVPAA